MKKDLSNDILVSIVVASYNKANYIIETVDSVLSQTFSNWELIIVDDCSTDNTLELLTTKYFDKRIKVIKNERNLGANRSRNKGIELAHGAYILFLDADDFLSENCLKNRVKWAKAHPETNLLVFTMGVFYKKPGDDPRVWKPISKDPLKDFLKHKLPWSILQPFWKREFISELQGFDETFKRLEDVELNTRALLTRNVRYVLVTEEPDCYYRIDDSRKNFSALELMRRWVYSSKAYFNKFHNLVSADYKRFLYGTIFCTYLQLIYSNKHGNISKLEFSELESELFAELRGPVVGPRRLLFRFTYFYNRFFIRIPGVNRLISLLIIL